MNNKKVTKRRVTKTTIESVLTEDDVRDLFNRMVKELSTVTDMICIYRDHEGQTNWKTTNGITLERILSMMEQAKFALLAQDSQTDEGEMSNE